MAGYALSAGMDAELRKSVTCVDLYFEGVTFSWNFLQSPGAASRPEYATALECNDGMDNDRDGLLDRKEYASALPVTASPM